MKGVRNWCTCNDEAKHAFGKAFGRIFFFSDLGRKVRVGDNTMA
jgi:hypothetical protein